MLYLMLISLLVTGVSFWKLNESHINLKREALGVKDKALLKQYLAQVGEVEMLLTTHKKSSPLYKVELEKFISEVHSSRKLAFCSLGISILIVLLNENL